MRRCPICDHSPVMFEEFNTESQEMEYMCDDCMTLATEEEIDEWWEERLNRENWQQPK